MKLQEIFCNLDSLPAGDVVYRPEGPLSLDSECYLLDADEDDDEAPVASAPHGLVESVSIREIRSIRENARLQGRKPDLPELLQAFVFYLDHDAFIEFS